MFKRVLMLLVCTAAAACGSSTPAAPSSTSSSSALSAPASFVITSQQVFLDRNIVAMSWSGGSSTYKVFAGSTAGASDLLSADVAGTTYTWTAPKTAGIFYVRVAATSGGQTGTASTELPVFTIDMRNVIDALYFGYGPMSDANGRPPAATVAVWPDGATINTLVTTESGDASLTAARTFVTDYLAATSNFISAPISTTTTSYKGVVQGTLPEDTVVVRVDNTVCPQTGVIACAYYGPKPFGPGSSFVNLNAAPTGNTPDSWKAIAHEIGHAFGLHHLVMNSSGRAEFQFLMNPALAVSQLSTIEKTAIGVARAGGIRPGWTRSQAQAAGLVLQ